VFVFRRDRRRICDGCGNSFRERFRPPWLSDLVIVCITVGSVLLLVDILPQEVKDYLGGGGFILTIVVSGIIGGGVLPAYLLNRTVPLKVAGGSAKTNDQPYPESKYQYPVVVLILLALAAFSFRSCSLNMIEGGPHRAVGIVEVGALVQIPAHLLGLLVTDPPDSVSRCQDSSGFTLQAIPASFATTNI
jgi:hypothetical protein